jgi:hypothetical protein
MPKFEKLRVSLARSDTPPMLETVGDGDHLSRTEFLRRAFAESRTFLRKDVRFTFHPIGAPDGFAGGFFAREHNVSLRHRDLEPYVAENYEPSLMVISLDKAQVIWMEDRTSVGSPKSILESFFSHLLRKTDLKDWEAYVRYFENDTGYWDAVFKYRQDIAKVIFRFVPPNAFEGEKWAQEFYTAIQKEAGNDILEETFKAKPGQMKLDGPLMKASAEIAEKGAGDRELRGAGNRLLYSSGDGKVTETVAEGDMPTKEQPAFIRRVIDRLFGR